MRMPIAYAINNGYTIPLMAQLVALYENANADTVYDIFILNYKLSKENRRLISDLVSELKPEAKVTFLDISDEQKAQIYYDHWGPETSYRGLLATLLPNEKSILYLDADTLVLEDLTHLMKVDLTGKLYAAVKDVFNMNDGPLKIAQKEENELVVDVVLTYDYINAGILLLNLDYWREHNLSEEFLRILKMGIQTKIIHFPDQDTLNYLAIKDGNVRICYLPITYNNAFHYTNIKNKNDNTIKLDELSIAQKIGLQAEARRRSRSVTDLALIQDRVIIVHFCGLKPWKELRVGNAFDELFQPYADRVGLKIPAYVPYRHSKNPILQWIFTSFRGENFYKRDRKLKLVLFSIFMLLLGMGFLIGYLVK